MKRTARHTASENPFLVRHSIGNRQARRRRANVFSDEAIGRGVGAIFEPLENRAMLSSAWLSDAVLNMHGGNSSGLDANLDQAVGHSGEVQVQMSGSTIQSFLRSDMARIDIVGTKANDSILLASNRPVAAEIEKPVGDDVIIDGAGNDTMIGGSGKDRGWEQRATDVIFGGSGFQV